MTDDIDIVERLRKPLPYCPFDPRSPLYLKMASDKPCPVCGGLDNGPDLCRGADTRIIEEAATLISQLRGRVAEMEALRGLGNVSNALWVDAEKEIKELYAMLKDVTDLAEALTHNINSPTLMRARDMISAAPSPPSPDRGMK